MTGSAAAERARRFGPTLFFTALAAYTVARSALRFPFADDFDLAVGTWPPSPAWLWAQHNDHRMPLPKLLIAWCARHGDFRLGPWLALALLAAACAWLVARVGRDRPLVCLLVPALALHPESNAWRWDVELQFATCVALVLVALAAALTARTSRDAAILAVASLLLPLTGANGVLYSAATVLAALLVARDPALPPRARAILLAGALATLAIDVAWLRHFAPSPGGTSAAGSPARLAVRLAVAPLGSVAERAPVAVALAAGAAGVVIAATTTLARRAIAAGFGAAALAVLVAIAVARAGRGWIFGLEAHYGLVLAPAYVAAVVAAVPTTTRQSRLRERALVADCGTLPADALAARYVTLLWDADTPPARARVAAWLARLDCAALRR